VVHAHLGKHRIVLNLGLTEGGHIAGDDHKLGCAARWEGGRGTGGGQERGAGVGEKGARSTCLDGRSCFSACGGGTLHMPRKLTTLGVLPSVPSVWNRSSVGKSVGLLIKKKKKTYPCWTGCA